MHLRIESPKHETKRALPSAVAWLAPLPQTPASPFLPDQHYTLLQKNREFKPHLLVIPVGSIVDFPNRDPFFHNVFSLFDGKRFDLGLYEAGSTKSVTFSREGVSYIFCNIHPEMSAVVLTLSTSLFSTADSGGSFHIVHVPQGEYELHVWIEGIAQPLLNRMVRRVRVTPDSGDLGVIEAPPVLLKATPHTTMYGQPYDRDAKPPY
ncbi:MAG TPA: hypothetical protein VK574_20880 [Terracidiphilus sp.]|nr:hypothetical protein [Terracidiphilus sp.]